jgi:hypothetical protein
VTVLVIETWGDGSVQDEQHAKDLESVAEQVERIP